MMRYGHFRELRRRFLKSLLAQRNQALILYTDHLKQAQAASRKFPDMFVLEQRIDILENLIEITQDQVRMLSRQLVQLERAVPIGQKSRYEFLN